MMLVQAASETREAVAWQPAVDVYQSPDGWVAKFELAGVLLEDIDVTVAGCRLTVSGIRRDRLCRAAHRPYSMEIRYNRFARSIEFPDNLDGAQARAEYQDGMLIVHLTFKDGG